jgi:DNA adenine methylase
MAPFTYFGGKGRMARWIIDRLPTAKIYVEPFCGAASVFWHLPSPYPVEVLNDRITGVFRCLQDRDLFAELAHRVRWTPYARSEFVRAIAAAASDNPVEAAWAWLVKQNQGFGGKLDVTAGSWGRALQPTAGGMASTAAKWRSRMAMLEVWHDRLTRVQIDNRDAVEVIRYWDTDQSLFYVDPPYVHATRTKGNRSAYAAEMTDEQHTRLVELLLAVRGQVVLSGYDSPLYAPLEQAGWQKHTRKTTASSAGYTRQRRNFDATRVECLWVKPM